MTAIPKHEPSKKTKGAKKTRLTLADMPPVADSAPFVDVDGIVEAMFRIAHSLKSYNVNACDGNNMLQVFTGPEGSGYHPVLLAFQGETSDRIATALERIADALAKTAGLNLPSLEFPVDAED